MRLINVFGSVCVTFTLFAIAAAKTGTLNPNNTRNQKEKHTQIAFCESFVGPSHDKLVVCYVSTWAVYRPGRGSFSLENIDPSLCTHLVYAFAGLNASSDSVRSLDPWQDLKDDYGKGGYARITELKKTHPHLKVSLAIGGWNEGSRNYSSLVADRERRERFVKSATDFVRQHNFDGLDLDWEYPTQR